LKMLLLSTEKLQLLTILSASVNVNERQ
jgi:hypothetical protein